jgi:hypothetical protein
MKTDGNFFTGAAHKIAALLIAVSFTNVLTACGNQGDKPASRPQNLQQMQNKADSGLREAIAIETELRNEQIFLGVSDYLRADAVSMMRARIASSTDADVVRLYTQIKMFKKEMVTAINAMDRGVITYNGPVSDLTNRRDTAAAFLLELKSEVAARGI